MVPLSGPVTNTEGNTEMNWQRHARLAWAALAAFLVGTGYVFMWNRTVEFHHNTFAVLTIAGLATYVLLCGMAAIAEWVYWNPSPAPYLEKVDARSPKPFLIQIRPTRYANDDRWAWQVFNPTTRAWEFYCWDEEE